MEWFVLFMLYSGIKLRESISIPRTIAITDARKMVKNALMIQYNEIGGEKKIKEREVEHLFKARLDNINIKKIQPKYRNRKMTGERNGEQFNVDSRACISINYSFQALFTICATNSNAFRLHFSFLFIYIFFLFFTQHFSFLLFPRACVCVLFARLFFIHANRANFFAFSEKVCTHIFPSPRHTIWKA